MEGKERKGKEVRTDKGCWDLTDITSQLVVVLACFRYFRAFQCSSEQSEKIVCTTGTLFDK